MSVKWVRPSYPVSLLAGMTLACTVAHAQSTQKDTDSVPPKKPKEAVRRADTKTKADKPKAESVDGNTENFVVHGSVMNILHEPIGIGRMPDDIMHTPQTVNAVPQVLMQQQNVKSLDEALRNVPGITASVGEGEGGMAGDQFLIRGFAAQNDIYENGLRDFGVYTRDSFDYDHISVIKGPSSEVFGNGTTGGAINITTKSLTSAIVITPSFWWVR